MHNKYFLAIATAGLSLLVGCDTDRVAGPSERSAVQAETVAAGSGDQLREDGHTWVDSGRVPRGFSTGGHGWIGPNAYHCHYTDDSGGDPGPVPVADRRRLILPTGWDCHYVPEYDEPDDPRYGGGSGGGSAPDTVYYGPFVYDVLPWADGPPDCSDLSALELAEKLWCQGDIPTAAERAALQNAADQIIQACPGLAPGWERSKNNVRFFWYEGVDWPDRNKSFGGASRRNGDWMLLSREWYYEDVRIAVGHELLHIAGEFHGEMPGSPEHDPDRWNAFITKEHSCYGNSALDYIEGTT